MCFFSCDSFKIMQNDHVILLKFWERHLHGRERKTADPSIRKKPGADAPLEGFEPLTLTRICCSMLNSNPVSKD